MRLDLPQLAAHAVEADDLEREELHRAAHRELRRPHVYEADGAHADGSRRREAVGPQARRRGRAHRRRRASVERAAVVAMRKASTERPAARAHHLVPMKLDLPRATLATPASPLATPAPWLAGLRAAPLDYPTRPHLGAAAAALKHAEHLDSYLRSSPVPPHTACLLYTSPSPRD